MKKSIADIISFLLIILWVYAAVSKLADIKLFASQLRQQPLPAWSTPILLWLLPFGEIVLAALLCLEISRSAGLLISSMLLWVFAAYIALVLSGAYRSIPCSCGGVFTFLGWKGHLVFNISTAVIAFAAWWWSKKTTKEIIHLQYDARNGKEAENPQKRVSNNYLPAAEL